MAAAANTAGTRKDPIDVDALIHNNPMPHPPTPGPIHSPNLPYFQCQSRDHIRKNCPDYHCPYCNRTAPGHNQSVCPEWECGLCQEKGHIVTNCPLMMTRTTMTSLRTRDMLETELVTQGNKRGNITVFLSFLSFPYGLIVSPSTSEYNITWTPM